MYQLNNITKVLGFECWMSITLVLVLEYVIFPHYYYTHPTLMRPNGREGTAGSIGIDQIA